MPFWLIIGILSLTTAAAASATTSAAASSSEFPWSKTLSSLLQVITSFPETAALLSFGRAVLLARHNTPVPVAKQLMLLKTALRFPSSLLPHLHTRTAKLLVFAPKNVVESVR